MVKVQVTDAVETKFRGKLEAYIISLMPLMLNDAVRRLNSDVLNRETVVDDDTALKALASLALGCAAAEAEPMSADGRVLFYRLKSR